ncbi:hypothetical protein BC835DRAFT_1061675 [Cytidiella melzeri]|nr:hypothetical protein BC835DRAFT_1061675 [Cytidiella melzeri]
MSRGTSRVRMLSPASVASSLQHITASDRHSEPTSSSDESFASISDASTSDEDDEIVWSMSDLSVSGSSQLAAMRSPGVLSDDDFIVLSPPLSQPREPASQTTSLSSSFVGSGAQSSSFDGLSEVMSNLNITESDSASDRSSSKASSRKQRKRAARATTAATTPVPAPATTKPKKKKSKGTVGSAPAERSASTSTKSKAKKAQASAKAQSGLGKRPIVDDVSEAGDAKTAVYEEAVQYVSECVSSVQPFEALFISFIAEFSPRLLQRRKRNQI